MDERGLTQLDFVRVLNRQYLTKFHQKDVSRWLNTGNRTSSGEIGFPKYETMATIADFFGVDVGYLTGETDEKTYAMSHACAFTGLSSSSIAAIRSWIGTTAESQTMATDDAWHPARRRSHARIPRRHHRPAAVIAEIPRTGGEAADIAGDVIDLEQHAAEIRGITRVARKRQRSAT